MCGSNFYESDVRISIFKDPKHKLYWILYAKNYLPKFLYQNQLLPNLQLERPVQFEKLYPSKSVQNTNYFPFQTLQPRQLMLPLQRRTPTWPPICGRKPFSPSLHTKNLLTFWPKTTDPLEPKLKSKKLNNTKLQKSYVF